MSLLKLIVSNMLLKRSTFFSVLVLKLSIWRILPVNPRVWSTLFGTIVTSIILRSELIACTIPRA